MPPKKILLIILMLGMVSLCLTGDSFPELTTVLIDEDAWLKAAVAYSNGEFTDAIKYYRIQADAGVVEGFLNLAVVLKDLGRYGEAADVLNKARLEHGQDQRVLLFLGRVLYLDNQLGEAIDIYKEIVSEDSGNIDALINLGACLKEKGEYGDARKYLRRPIVYDGDNIMARYLLADLYYQNDEFEEAADEYRVLISLDASILDFQRKLGDSLFRLSRLEDALRAYQRVNAVNPSDVMSAGRISEISGKLGREYFEKEKAKVAMQREKKAVFVKPLPEIKNAVFVRVGLISSEDKVEFKASVPFEAKGKDSDVRLLKGSANKVYFITTNDEGSLVISCQDESGIIADEPILTRALKPEGTVTLFNISFGKGNFWAGKSDRSYRGVMEIAASGKDRIGVINILNLEEYLYGVLPSEMSSHWPEEALKAQAVAARSESVRKIGRHKNEGFDFCPEVHCQVYAGVERETQATNSAVDETRGLVMLHRGRPIDAIYSSNCGGHTQDNIFSDAREIPYLKGRVDSSEDIDLDFPLSPLELEYWLRLPPKGLLCGTSSSRRSSAFRWVRIYSAEQVNEMINKISDVGRVNRIIVVKRNKSGHINALKVIGEDSEHILEKELHIRNVLGNLRSAMFKVELKYGPEGGPQQFIFYGGGWGHGVGMCQTGAHGMAASGRGYRQILQHYFQEIEFERIY